MSTSSKPRHGEAITKIIDDGSGNKVGVPTRQFQSFLDELEANASTTEDTQQSLVSPAIATSGLRKDLANVQQQIQAQKVKGSNQDKRFTDLEQQVSIHRVKPEDLSQKVSNLEHLVAQLLSQVGFLLSSLSSLSFKVVTITADFTTTGNMIVICNNTSAITVTLNPSADNGERIFVKRNDSFVDLAAVVGIDGSATKKILSKYDEIPVVYTASIDEWSVL